MHLITVSMSFCNGFLRVKIWRTCHAIHDYVGGLEFFGFLKSIFFIRGMCLRRALICASDHVFYVFLQWIFTFKKIGKPIVQYMVMFQKWIFFNFLGFSKSIFSIRGMYPRRALSCASDHVFDVFLQWIFIFKRIGTPVMQYMVMF